MKMFNWIVSKPSEASTDELALQLENAEASLRQAQEAEGQAQEAFDLDPSKEAAALKASEAVARARAHVERAQRLLDARRREEAQQERDDIEARLKELEQQMYAARAKADRLHEQTAEALLRTSNAYAIQLKNDEHLSQLEHEYSQLAHGLGDRGEFHEIQRDVTSGRPKPYWNVVLRLFDNAKTKLDRESHEYRAAEEIRRSMSR